MNKGELINSYKTTETKNIVESTNSCYNCKFFRVNDIAALAICRCNGYVEILGSMFGFNSRACTFWKKERLPRKTKKQYKQQRLKKEQNTTQINDNEDLPF